MEAQRYREMMMNGGGTSGGGDYDWLKVENNSNDTD